MEKYKSFLMDFFRSLCNEYGQGEGSMRVVFFEDEHGKKSTTPTFVFSYSPQLLVGKRRNAEPIVFFHKEDYGEFIRLTPSGAEIYKSLAGMYVRRTQNEQPKFSVEDFVQQERRNKNVYFAFLLFQEEQSVTFTFTVTDTPVLSKAIPSFMRSLTLKNDGGKMKTLFSKKSVKDKQAKTLFPNEIKIICNKILAQHTHLLGILKPAKPLFSEKRKPYLVLE